MGQYLQYFPGRKLRQTMKVAKPANAWTITRPLAGVCLLAATSACALIPGFRDVVSQEAETTPRATVEGMPPALTARAKDLVRRRAVCWRPATG